MATNGAPDSLLSTLASVEQSTQSILVLRGTPVIIDRDLAAIYSATTGRLNEDPIDDLLKRNLG